MVALVLAACTDQGDRSPDVSPVLSTLDTLITVAPPVVSSPPSPSVPPAPATATTVAMCPQDPDEIAASEPPHAPPCD